MKENNIMIKTKNVVPVLIFLNKIFPMAIPMGINAKSLLSIRSFPYLADGIF